MAEKADVVVSPMIKAILDKLVSPLLQDFGSEWEVEKELIELCKTLEKIDAMLGFVEMNQQRDALLRILLRDLRDEAYYADDVLDEFSYEAQQRKLEDESPPKRRKLENGRNQNISRRQVHTFLSFSLNADQLLRRHEITPLVTEITEKFVSIEKKLEPHYFEGLAERRHHDMLCRLQTLSSRGTRQMTASSIEDSNVFGRREDADAIINILLSESHNEREVSIVAMVGMGGIGKTTLAQLVYNDPNVKQHFNVRSWVCVSEDFDVVRLIRAILESIREEPNVFNELQPLQKKLEDRLRGKRFLLVLDDVWNENPSKWDALRVPFGVTSKGSTIIVTTRSQRVSSVMGAIEMFCLKGLSDEDCWLLFEKRAFNNYNSDAHPNLKPIGKKIVRKCKGLPLAVHALGGLLNGKVHEEEWQFILDSEMWNLEEVDILPALRLSYHHLPPHLKLCFAYCSLFTKDFKFDKEMLVRLWMAEGFVPSKKAERMEDIGGQYFDDLFHRSFFQKVKETFVMHDLIHDLAQSVSSRMCFRMERDKSCEVSGKVRHMSLNIYDLNLVQKEFCKCRRLSTFLNLGVESTLMRQTSMHVPHDLFDALRCLRVLDLSKSHLERGLPDSIGNLKHLRYLDLSDTPITVLPEQTCNLYNLQTLILKYCYRLHELPTSMGNLINLQHLIMDDISWHKCGQQLQGIGRLTCLKTLPFFSVGQEDGFKIKELHELQHLQGLLCVSELQNVVNALEAKAANLKNKQKLDGLKLCWNRETRHLRDGGNVEYVLEGLQPHTGLKRLTIRSYCGLRFPSWMTTDFSSYNKMVLVELDSCHNCKILPPLGQLYLLKSLEIQKMGRVQYLRREFYGDDKKGFQSLKLLRIIEMVGLEDWSGAEEGEFPCLQKLIISDCPKLRTLPPLLPAVKELEITSCRVLTILPRLPSISKISLVRCDERLLSSLQPLISLQSLKMDGFNRLEYLSEDIGLQDLVSLQNLEIYSCPRLVSLPDRLHCLSSLHEIYIDECGIVVLFPEEASLPPMLNRLDISRCCQLESLSNKLQNLSSLQKLRILGCSNLTSLPEDGLPTGLRSLTIMWCPELVRQCREGGEDCPRLAHIPEVHLYE